MKKILFLFILFTIILLNADAKESLNFGKSMYNNKLYIESIKALEIVIKDYPTSTQAEEAIFYIAEAYSKLNKYKNAKNYYKMLYEGYPNSAYRQKSLAMTANMEFKDKNYKQAMKTYSELIRLYPKTESTKKNILQYVKSYFLGGAYQETISVGNRMINNYPQNTNNPDIYLLIAKAHYKVDSFEEGNAVLNKLEEDYKDKNAYWEAKEILIEQKINNNELLSAIDDYNNLLTPKLPRDLESKFRLKLADLYLESEDLENAKKQFDVIIKKFNNQNNMDKIIIKYYRILDNLKKYNIISENIENNYKYFKKSDLKDQFQLYNCKAEIINKNFKNAKKILSSINSDEEKTKKEITFFNALIAEMKGNFTKAVNLYSELLNSNYYRYEEILTHLGNIYLNKLQRYNIALKYFERLSEVTTNSLNRAKTQYKISECYQNMRKFSEALNELYFIDMNAIKDDKFKEKIINKQIFLKEFYQKDYESAFGELISTLFLDKSKEEKKTDLINIMIYNLKQYEEALNLFPPNSSNYQIGFIKIKLIKRNTLNNNIAEVEKLNEEVTNIIEILSGINKQNALDLTIRQNLVNTKIINKKSVDEMKNFIFLYPNADSSVYFRTVLGNSKIINDDEKITYLKDIFKTPELSKFEFLNNKLKLAELFYHKQDYNNAIKNYKLSNELINLNSPNIMMNYAVSLINSREINEGYNKLIFLVNNTENFSDFPKAVSMLMNYYKEKNEINKAIEYYLKTPDKNKNDLYFSNLAKLYIEKNDKENAKLAIMHIKKKDNNTLRTLANLHFETNDYPLAIYTYKDLLKKDKENTHIYLWNLGHIYYLEENFEKAAFYLNKLVSNHNNLEELDQTTIAKEAIISYLRIENRPKADSITKKFKKLIKKDINTELEIEINKAIYYKNLDSKKAEKILSSVIKNKKVTNNIIIQATYWRGIVRIENKKPDLAITDFENILKNNKNFVVKSHLKLGTIYFSKEKYQKALQHYYYVIKNDKNGTLALNASKNYAFVCKTTHKWSEAINAYEIILDRWGDEKLQSETFFDIAFCFYRDKKYIKAIPMFQRAINLGNNRSLQAEAQYWIGESFYGLEEYNEAVLAFLKVGFQYSDQSLWAGISELKAAESYLKMNQIDTAKNILNGIIKKYGTNSDVGKQAKKILNTL